MEVVLRLEADDKEKMNKQRVGYDAQIKKKKRIERKGCVGMSRGQHPRLLLRRYEFESC